MAIDERKIAILGAGQIGEALISGLLSSGWRTAAELSASTRREERADELRERHGIDVTLSNAEAASGAALVVIAVKPQDIETLLGEIGPLIQPEQTVLSIAAAIPTADDRAPPRRRACRSSARCRTRPRSCTRGWRESAPAPTPTRST